MAKAQKEFSVIHPLWEKKDGADFYHSDQKTDIVV